MIRLLKWLFTGDAHLHKWKHIETINSFNKDKDIVGMMWILQCEKCGEIKREFILITSQN